MPPIATVTRFVYAVTHQKRGDPSAGDNATNPDTGKKPIIILSSAIPVGVLLLAAVAVCLFWRKKQRRIRLFSRTVTPVDDEEIATWKAPKSEEAGFTTSGDNTDVDGKSRPTTGDRLNTSHGKQPSTSSVKTVKKPASVIVYTNPQDQAAAGGESRKSLDEGSPRSAAHSTHSGYYGKTSIDHTQTPLPPTPILARAPNSRAGLTDETVPGDVPFIPAPKRQPSRLYKLPPSVAGGSGSSAVLRPRHGRKRSSKSSTSSIGGYSPYNNNYNIRAAYYRGGGYTSDTEGGIRGRGFPGRHSHDHARTRSMHHTHHTRLHSGVTVPPRLSLGDDALPSRRQFLREEEVGRAIG